MIGTTLSHYRIVELIGAGGMGEVYRAHDERLDRDVAIKVLPEAVAQDPARLERFEREARAAAVLSHPNILAVYELGEHEGRPFIACELLAGSSLRDRMREGPLSAKFAVGTALQIVAGLAAAHERGITHRDLKPENVFITRDGTVKILDFGLAKLTQPDQAFTAETPTATLHTTPGTMVGTAAYMAPEQVRGEPADHRSDLFSLGVMLHEMVAGRRPFRGATAAATTAAILTAEPEPLSSAPAQVSPALAALVSKCLEKDPRDRFQSAHDLGLALEMASEPSIAVATARPAVRFGLSRRVILTLATLVIVAGSVALYLGLCRGGEAPGIGASGRPSVAVMPFEDHTGSDSSAWLATGLPSMVVTGLAQTRGLDVVSSESVMEVLTQLGCDDAGTMERGLVPKAARRLGAGAVVVGRIYASGPAFRIDVQVQDVASGRLLAAHTAQGEDVFPLADQLAGQVRASLHLADAPRARAIADLATSSLEAYRLYWQGHEAFAQNRYEDAARLLGAAVELDPAFAMAHLELWLMHSGYATTANTEAASHRKQLVAHLDRLTDRQRLIVQALITRADGDPAGAVELLQRLIADYPDELWGYELLAAIQYYSLGQLRESIVTKKLRVGRFPNDPMARFGYGYALMLEGRFDEALGEFETYAALSPREPNPVDCLGDYFLMTGQITEALEQFERAAQIDPLFGSQSGLAWAHATLGRYDQALEQAARSHESQMFSTPYFFSAFLLSRVGRYREAEQQLLEGERFWSDREDLAKQASLQALRTIIALERGDLAGARDRRARLRSACGVLQGWEYRSMFQQLVELLDGVAAARSGDLEVAHERLQAFEESLTRLRTTWSLLWHDMLRSEVSLAAGGLDRAEVSPRLRRSGTKMEFNRGFLDLTVFMNCLPFRDAPARASVARGDLGAAIASYRQLLTPARERELTAVLEPRYVLELARLLDRTGDRVAAREEYERFLELWKDADEGLPELEEARARLARLRR